MSMIGYIPIPNISFCNPVIPGLGVGLGLGPRPGQTSTSIIALILPSKFPMIGPNAWKAATISLLSVVVWIQVTVYKQPIHAVVHVYTYCMTSRVSVAQSYFLE